MRKFHRNKSWNRNRVWDIYHLSLTTAFFVSLTNNISLWRVSKKQTWKDVYASSKWYIFSADDLNYHLDCKWPLFSNNAPTLFLSLVLARGTFFTYTCASKIQDVYMLFEVQILSWAGIIFLLSLEATYCKHACSNLTPEDLIRSPLFCAMTFEEKFELEKWPNSNQ